MPIWNFLPGLLEEGHDTRVPPNALRPRGQGAIPGWMQMLP